MISRAIVNPKLELANTAKAAHGVVLDEAVVTEVDRQLESVHWDGVIQLAYNDRREDGRVSCTRWWVDNDWSLAELSDVVAVKVGRSSSSWKLPSQRHLAELFE
jgi:hypothetical protein